MQKEVILSPEELYALGTRLQARYIDYAYVAAMEDIGQNYPLFERETGAALVKRGILEEDFSGTVTISAEVEGLLRPVFFGELETSIDICTFGKPNTVRVMKFHFHDEAITMVVGQEGKLLLRQIDRLGIEKLVEELLPADYDCAVEEVADVPRDGLTRYFAFKCTQVGERAEVKTYVESNGVLYHERSAGRVETVPRKSFLDEAAALVKGV